LYATKVVKPSYYVEQPSSIYYRELVNENPDSEEMMLRIAESEFPVIGIFLKMFKKL
jgi:hypothetical protein